LTSFTRDIEKTQREGEANRERGKERGRERERERERGKEQTENVKVH